MTEIYLIAGLGNPGRQYRETRHNLGFMVIDSLASHEGITFNRLQSNALLTSYFQNDRKILLAKPQTFMNLSGRAISALIRFYRTPISNLLVVCDDIDLPLGVVRMRPSGSAGGQKGMNSVIENLGTMDIPRLRLGIGRPPGRMDAADYVLQDFSSDELDSVDGVINTAVKAIQSFINMGLVETMNHFNA